MTATAKEYLSPAEFAALSTLSEATVRRRIKDGSIPTYQPGGHRTRILIPRDALERSRKAEGEPLNQLRASDHNEGCSAKTDSLLVSPNIPGPSPQWKRSI